MFRRHDDLLSFLRILHCGLVDFERLPNAPEEKSNSTLIKFLQTGRIILVTKLCRSHFIDEIIQKFNPKAPPTTGGAIAEFLWKIHLFSLDPKNCFTYTAQPVVSPKDGSVSPSPYPYRLCH
jgi:hypothetical protein